MRPAICELAIPLAPVGKGRPRVGNGRAYTPQKTRDYEAAVALFMRRAVRQVNATDDLYLHVYFRVTDRRRRDIDNLVKALLDAGNGIIWADDKQIVELQVYLERGAAVGGTELVAGLARTPVHDTA